MNCGGCGAEVPEGNKFCGSCGKPTPAAEQQRAKPDRKKLIIPAIFTIIILAIVFKEEKGPVDTSAADKALLKSEESSVPRIEESSVSQIDESQGGWHYRTSKDEVRNGDVITASTISTNKVYLDSPYEGGSSVRMTARKHPEWGLDIFFTLSSGQLLCNSYRDCHAMVRFDDGPARKFNLNEPSDNSSDTVFVSADSTFLASLKKSKKTVVELEIYQHGRPQFTFETAGLEWPPEQGGRGK